GDNGWLCASRAGDASGRVHQGSEGGGRAMTAPALAAAPVPDLLEAYTAHCRTLELSADGFAWRIRHARALLRFHPRSRVVDGPSAPSPADRPSPHEGVAAGQLG